MNLRMTTEHVQGAIDLEQAEKLRLDLYHALGGQDNPTGAIRHNVGNDDFIEATRVKKSLLGLGAPVFDIKVKKGLRYDLTAKLRQDRNYSSSTLTIQVNCQSPVVPHFNNPLEELGAIFDLQKLYQVVEKVYGRIDS